MKQSSILIIACLCISALSQAPKVDLIGSTPVYPSSSYLTNIFEVNSTRLISFTGGEQSKIYEACTYNFETNTVTEWKSDICLLSASTFLFTDTDAFYCAGPSPKDRTALVINKIDPFPTPKVLSTTSLNLGVSDSNFVSNSDNVFVITSLGFDVEPVIYVFDGVSNSLACTYSPNVDDYFNVEAIGGSSSNIIYVTSKNNLLTYTTVNCQNNNAVSTSGALNLGSFTDIQSGFFSLNSGSVYINYNNFLNETSKLVVVNAATAQVADVVTVSNTYFTESSIPQIVTYGNWIWKLNDSSFNVLTNHNNWVYLSTYSVNSSQALVKVSEVPLGLFNASFSLFVPGVNYLTLYFATNLYSEYAEIDLSTNQIVKVYTGNAPAILANGTWIKYGQYGYYVLSPSQTYTFTFLPINDYFYSPANYSLVWGLFIPNVTTQGTQCYLVNINCATNSVSTITLNNCPYTLNLENDFELQDVSQIGDTLYVMYQSPYGDIWVLEGNQTSYYVNARENLQQLTEAYPDYYNHTLKIIPGNKWIYTYNYVTGQYLYNQSLEKNTYGHTTVNEQAIFVEIHTEILTTEYQILNLTTFKPIVDVKRPEIAVFTPLKKDYDAAVLGVSYTPSFSVGGWVNAVLFAGIQRCRVYDFKQDLFTDVNIAGPIIPVNDETFAIQTVTTSLVSQFNVYKVKFASKNQEKIEF